MGWFDEAKEIYGIEEEAVEKMAEVDVAEGGRLQLPDVGEEILIFVTREPTKVESEKLKDMGITTAMFGRCKLVVQVNGRYELSEVEYDFPLSKTMAMSAAASLKKHGSDMTMGSKVFLITAREWKDAPEEYKAEKGIVKTYYMAYKPEITSLVKGTVSVTEDEIEI